MLWLPAEQPPQPSPLPPTTASRDNPPFLAVGCEASPPHLQAFVPPLPPPWPPTASGLKHPRLGRRRTEPRRGFLPLPSWGGLLLPLPQLPAPATGLGSGPYGAAAREVSRGAEEDQSADAALHQGGEEGWKFIAARGTHLQCLCGTW